LLFAVRSEDRTSAAMLDYRAAVRFCFDGDSFSRLRECQARHRRARRGIPVTSAGGPVSSLRPLCWLGALATRVCHGPAAGSHKTSRGRGRSGMQEVPECASVAAACLLPRGRSRFFPAGDSRSEGSAPSGAAGREFCARRTAIGRWSSATGARRPGSARSRPSRAGAISCSRVPCRADKSRNRSPV